MKNKIILIIIILFIIGVILVGATMLVDRFIQLFKKDPGRAKENIAYCLKTCELPQPHNYTIRDSAYSPTFTDVTMKYILIVNKDYYDTLMNEIISKPYYIKTDSIYSLPSVYDRNSDTSKVKEAAFSYKGQTTYERLDTEIGESIHVTLKKDSLLSIEFDYN